MKITQGPQMALSSLLSHWRAEPTIATNVVEWHSVAAHQAQFVGFPAEMHPGLIAALASKKISDLYTHQSEAWRLVNAGQNVVIVTGTASGKTLCYNLPVLNRLLHHPDSRALYLFPTKSLAQDQAETLREFIKDISLEDRSLRESTLPQDLQSKLRDGLSDKLVVSVYDGDTPSHARPPIRERARIVLSNPDMLHRGILPHHTRWIDFFKNLDFIIIDELHVYRGVFGSHVANVIRRLKRIAAFYGAHPQFIMTSATIANPIELAERLVEKKVRLVDQNGSARGAQNFLIYNPPVVDRELGLRRSALLESVRLAEDLFHYNIQTIIFGRARRTIEIMLTYLKEKNPSNEGSFYDDTIHRNSHFDRVSQENDVIRGYRSGYLPSTRRSIERGLQNGNIRAVVATNALELGIDVGGMGAAILAGYPGSIAATWQQAGRAGRGNLESLAVLVATASPLDQYLAHHPEYFFERSPEQALINPDNLLILFWHLRCAAFEMPFKEGDSFGRVSGDELDEFLQYLDKSGDLHHSGGKFFWMSEKYPSDDVSLRSASPERVLLQQPDLDSWVTFGEVDLESALWMVHPHAVYLHEAQSFLVEELDLDNKIAHLHPRNLDYYTTPLSETTVQLQKLMAQSEVTAAIKSFGDIQVTTRVKGYRKVKWYTHENLGQGELDLPPSDLSTMGYWIALSEECVSQLRESGLWSNDSNRYGSNWSIQRERARARDEYRCQTCGVQEGDIMLHVHHKTPFRAFSTPEEANQLSNLITLCPTCHNQAEAAVRVHSGLSGLAYALGNLAPIFLMCDDHDLGIHADPKSPLSQGTPVVLLYDRIPAGIGFSQRLYELHDEIMTSTYELVKDCECLDGCPSCVGPGGENGWGGKKETLALLKLLTGKDI